MAKKRRVPEVLWRLFRDNARTLATTIISFVPSPPSYGSVCRLCKGRRCVSCSGNAMSFLLRPGDPSDYHNLLKHCYVVVPSTAPSIPRFYPDNRWSQHEIVKSLIEIILCEKTPSSNVICSGYNRIKQSSPIVELLTRSDWSLLLERVGDEMVFYLLKYCSIFLPLPRKKHQQVAGSPINNLCFNMSKKFPKQQPSLVPCGIQLKRKREDDANTVPERQKFSKSFCVDRTTSWVTEVACLTESASRCNTDQDGLVSRSEPNNEKHRTCTANTESSLDQICKHSIHSSIVKQRKRSRPFKWQRPQKRKQLDPEEATAKAPLTRMTCIDSIPGRHGLKSSATDCFKKCLAPVMQVQSLVAKGTQINRKSLFYNLERSSSVLLKSHILNSLKPNSSGSKSLIRSIFGISDVTASSLEGFKCKNQSLIKKLKILIGRARSCQHLRLLDKHCEVTKSQSEHVTLEASRDCSEHCVRSLETTIPMSEAIRSYCSKSQVTSFIWAACRSIVPPDLLGTTSNWRILRRNISKFIRLRRFETFSIKQCVHKLKTSEFPFLSTMHPFCCLNNHMREQAEAQCLGKDKGFTCLNDATHTVKQKFLEGWMYWIFTYLVVPLLQSNFYITESEHGKQDVFFYRKSVWEKVTDNAISCLKNQGYQYLDDVAARHIISHRAFGFSKLRLCPKGVGVRLLANLKAPSKMPAKGTKSIGVKRSELGPKNVKFDLFKSVNCVLRDTHAVLKGVQLQETEMLGSSVFDYNDVYKKLCPFLIGLKDGSLMMPSMYVVVSDVAKAFDSIDQDKLLNVMKDFLRKDEYIMKQSYQVLCNKKCLWAHETHELMDQDMSSKFTSTFFLSPKHSILVNQEFSRSMKKDELFFNLKEHVKHNVLQLNKNFYLQGLGIPQGSVLSSLLCSLYYGHMDRKLIFPFLEKTSEPVVQIYSRQQNSQDASAIENSNHKIASSCSYMLLRFIDDFLFMSTSRDQAEKFFHMLRTGFPDYNCYMNENKFCINFDIELISGLPSNRVCVGEDGISFLRWSGLLINCCTLEVQADYTRYLNCHLSSSLTICWQGKPGRHLKSKLCSYMRPKCHPIFFDSNINSAAVIRLNIYQSFLLCAMKFHCYVCEISYFCKFQTRYYLSIIERSFRYMHSLIKKRMRSAHLGSNLRPILQLEDGEVEWLGLNAYMQVLKRKQSRYKHLLLLLKSQLSAHKMSVSGFTSSALSYAVDRSHSSLLWKIKY